MCEWLKAIKQAVSRPVGPEPMITCAGCGGAYPAGQLHPVDFGWLCAPCHKSEVEAQADFAHKARQVMELARSGNPTLMTVRCRKCKTSRILGPYELGYELAKSGWRFICPCRTATRH